MCVDLSAYFLPWLNLRSYSIIQSIKTCFVATGASPSSSAQGKRRRGEEIIVCSRWISDITKNRCRRGAEILQGINPKFFPGATRCTASTSIFGPITVFESLGFGTAYALTTIMIATFALFVILSATNGWVVTHPHAWIYLAIYAAFVVYVILDAIPGIVPGPASR